MRQDRLEQLGKHISQGLLGSSVQAGFKEYQGLTDPNEVFLKTINDFYNSEISPEFEDYPHSLIHTILFLYFKNEPNNPEIANYFPEIFQQEIPSVKGTYIFDKYMNLLEIGTTFKKNSNTDDPLLLWEIIKKYHLAINEFLNALSGVILINYRFFNGLSYNVNAVGNNYGSKIKELIDLNIGSPELDNLLETTRPDLRNAIAHENIWLDSTNQLVKYRNKNDTSDNEMSISEFVMLLSKSAYYAEAYLVAISTIMLFSSNKPEYRAKLPKALFLKLMDIISPSP